MAEEIMRRKDALAQGLTSYSTNKPCKYGHIAKRWTVNGTCAECDSIKKKTDGWHIRHPERHLESSRRYYNSAAGQARHQRRVESGEHQRRSKERWERLTPEQRRAERISCYNSENATAYMRQWRKDHPEEARIQGAIHTRSRRALKLNAEGSHTHEDTVAIQEAQDHLCPYAGYPEYCRVDLQQLKSFEKHVDHIHPLAREGSNDKANIQITCAPCGLRKSDKYPLDFAKEIGMPLDKAPAGQTNEQYRATQR